jgi:hypothetical protein
MVTPPDVVNLAAVRKNGRPAYVPTEDQRRFVQAMRANGVDNETIAGVLRISISTLKKYFRPELADGFELIKARMGLALVKAALNGNVGALRVSLVMRGGPEWRIPKGAALSDDNDDSEEVVHFFLPPNGRDGPEALDEAPPIIEGESISSATWCYTGAPLAASEA